MISPFLLRSSPLSPTVGSSNHSPLACAFVPTSRLSSHHRPRPRRPHIHSHKNPQSCYSRRCLFEALCLLHCGYGRPSPPLTIGSIPEGDTSSNMHGGGWHIRRYRKDIIVVQSRSQQVVNFVIEKGESPGPSLDTDDEKPRRGGWQ